jgi:hypothetical protein
MADSNPRRPASVVRNPTREARGDDVHEKPCFNTFLSQKRETGLVAAELSSGVIVGFALEADEVMAKFHEY